MEFLKVVCVSVNIIIIGEQAVVSKIHICF